MSSVDWVSDELAEALASLTMLQARGVVRIVEAELTGRSLASLLRPGPGKICAWGTYHGTTHQGKRRRGWKDKPIFQTALSLARRDYRAWALEQVTGQTLQILTATGPDAARVLRQRVVGDDVALASLMVLLSDQRTEVRSQAAAALGATGLPVAALELSEALATEEDADVRAALVAALGQVATGEPRDMGAAQAILSRVLGDGGEDVGSGEEGSGLQGTLAGMGNEELRKLRANLEAVELGDAEGRSQEPSE